MKTIDMKSLLTLTLFCACTIFGIAQNSKTSALVQPAFLEGQFTVKLKADVGDFEAQSGMVSFNIPSLDAMVQEFSVYKIEKRFKYNPKKARPDLPDLSRIYKFSYSGSENIEAVVHAFAADPNVEYAELISIAYTSDVPNDILYEDCQHLPQIMAEEAWDIHKGEDGEEPVVIAIVDSGTEWTDEDLTDNLWQNLAEDADGDGVTIEFIDGEWVLDPDDLDGIDDDDNGYIDDLIGWDVGAQVNLGDGSNPDPAPFSNSHGTHCTGIAAGTTNNEVGISSVSYNLTYMPVHVGGQGTSIPFGYEGIIYAAENGADIISCSWGGTFPSLADQEVLNYAHGLGSIIVAAAGNNGNDFPHYPSHFIHVISVAAVNEDDTKASFSSFQWSVDIAAPGVGILSTVIGNEYESYNGTSMATPMIAGALGLLKSYHPDWTNEELVFQMVATADNIDDENEGFDYELGTGRINAYEMLVGDPETPYLKLDLEAMTSTDDNGNGANEQGELVSLDFKLRNYMQAYGEDNVAVSITSNDPDIIIVDGEGTVNVPADSIFDILDQFEIQVAADASPHFADLTLHFDADIEIPIGESHDFQLLVAPGGILVFEGEVDENTYSGTFFASRLSSLGYDYVYTTSSVESLLGFDAVFISAGNPGQNADQNADLGFEVFAALQEYADAGGNIYIEAGGFFLGSFFNEHPLAQSNAELFGVDDYATNFTSEPINNLVGYDETIMEGISFSGSTQSQNWYIDDLTPLSTAQIPFYMDTYGDVSIMNTGAGYKTFYLGYAMAPLIDNSMINSRNNVFVKVLEFFDYNLPEAYTLSNFIADVTSGPPNSEINFTDISLHDPLFEITSWKWDFDNDGVIDSEEQNPSWTYTEGGVYDVRLITETDGDIDTLVIEDYISINSGYFVYDGDFEGADYSGAYIYDYLIENGYEAYYRDEIPNSLMGFDAAFLSFGNFGSGYTELNDEMADVIQNYIEEGGGVYLEGGDALGYDQETNTALHNLFGLASVDDGTNGNGIDSLYGHEAGIMNGMYFSSNNQDSNEWIDIFATNANGVAAYSESNYGTVGVQRWTQAHRTFCFSYALSKLDDGEFPSTKDEFIFRLLNFFDFTSSTQDRITAGNAFNCVAYPNPMSGQTTIEYTLQKESLVILEVTDARGQLISQYLNENQPQGTQRFDWNAEDLPGGMYFYTIRVDNESYTGKIIRLD